VPNAGRWESGCFGAEGVPRRASRTRSISAEFQRKVLILGREDERRENPKAIFS